MRFRLQREAAHYPVKEVFRRVRRYRTLTPLRVATRFASTELLARVGSRSVAVALAGLTLGFFAWYAVIVPRHHGAPRRGSAACRGDARIAARRGCWLGIRSLLFAPRRHRRSRARCVRRPYVGAVSSASGSRSCLRRRSRTARACFSLPRSLFCVGKVLIAARFNQTVREVLLDFVGDASRDHRHRRTRRGDHRPARRHARSGVASRRCWPCGAAGTPCTTSTSRRKGYQGTDMAFFPLYPLLIRFVGALAGNHLIAGLLISNASFFFGLLFLYKLLEHEYDRAVARRAIFYVSIFPTAVLLLGGLHRVALLHADGRVVLLHARASLVAGRHDRLLRRADARRRRPAGRAVRHRMVRAGAPASPRGRSSILFAGALIPLGSRALHGLPLGAARRSALLLARTGPLEPASRAALGQRGQCVRKIAHATEPQIVANQSLESPSPLLMIAVLARRLAQLAAVVHRLHGAFDPRADVDLEPDVDAALCARALPDVRHFGALGRAAVGQQRHPGLLAAAARPLHRALCGLVLGCVARRRRVRARLKPRRGVRQFVKFGSSAHRVSVVNFWPPSRSQRIVPLAAAGSLIFAIGFMLGGVSNYYPQPGLDVRLAPQPDASRACSSSAVSAVALLFGKVVFELAARTGLRAFHDTWFVATARRDVRQLLPEQVLDVPPPQLT